MAIRLACEIPEHLAAVGPEIGSLEAMNGNRWVHTHRERER